MGERVKLEPTMEEIVVALRETRQGAGRPPAFTLVGGHPARNWTSNLASRGGKRVASSGSVGATDVQSEVDSINVADLRDGEIERLLIENARLNERVVFLLKVIEREQARNAEPSVEPKVAEMDHGAIFRDVRMALEAELRPVLLVLLRLLEKQRADPTKKDARHAALKSPRLTMPSVTPSDWIAHISRKLDGENDASMQKNVPAAAAVMRPRRTLRQRMIHAFDALCA